jgi:hypothetical protein
MATKRTAAQRKSTATKGVLRYEPDQGPLTRRQMATIDRLQSPGRMKVKKNLF